jgi:hypothetical protein
VYICFAYAENAENNVPTFFLSRLNQCIFHGVSQVESWAVQARKSVKFSCRYSSVADPRTSEVKRFSSKVNMLL